jgi:uncharacterized membrane protein
VTDQRTNKERLKGVYRGIEEVAREMSIDELREEIRADGYDPDTVVRDVRNLFSSITKEHKQKTLRAMQAQAAAAVQDFHQRKARIPKDRDARRALYMDVAQKHPQFTIQHRDLAAIPDEDIEQTLEQMDALGLLPEEDE